MQLIQFHLRINKRSFGGTVSQNMIPQGGIKNQFKGCKENNSPHSGNERPDEIDIHAFVKYLFGYSSMRLIDDGSAEGTTSCMVRTRIGRIARERTRKAAAIAYI